MLAAHEVTVRFSEVDAAGVAFFSRFFEWCHEAWEEALAGALGRWFEAMRAQGWGLPLVHAEADYLRPARLGDRLRVRIEGLTLREGRLRVRFAIEGANDVRHANVEHVHAFVALSGSRGFRPIDAPSGFLGQLRSLGLEVGEE